MVGINRFSAIDLDIFASNRKIRNIGFFIILIRRIINVQLPIFILIRTVHNNRVTGFRLYFVNKARPT